MPSHDVHTIFCENTSLYKSGNRLSVVKMKTKPRDQCFDVAIKVITNHERMGLAGHVVGMGYHKCVRNFGLKAWRGNLGVDWRIIMKWTSRKWMFDECGLD